MRVREQGESVSHSRISERYTFTVDGRDYIGFHKTYISRHRGKREVRHAVKYKGETFFHTDLDRATEQMVKFVRENCV